MDLEFLPAIFTQYTAALTRTVRQRKGRRGMCADVLMERFSEATLPLATEPNSPGDAMSTMRPCIENGRGDSKDTVQHDDDLEDDIRRNGNCRTSSWSDWYCKTWNQDTFRPGSAGGRYF